MRANAARLVVWCATLALVGCGDDGGDDGGSHSDAGPLADAAAGSGGDAASGRACFTGAEMGDPTLLASPALECPSRVCLHVEGLQPDVCTASCDTALDCFAAPESTCDGPFACTEVVELGPFACQKFCVCESSVPEGGFVMGCGGAAARGQ